MVHALVAAGGRYVANKAKRAVAKLGKKIIKKGVKVGARALLSAAGSGKAKKYTSPGKSKHHNKMIAAKGAMNMVKRGMITPSASQTGATTAGSNGDFELIKKNNYLSKHQGGNYAMKKLMETPRALSYSNKAAATKTRQ